MKKLINRFQFWLIEQGTQQAENYVAHQHEENKVTTRKLQVITVEYQQVLAARLKIKRVKEGYSSSTIDSATTAIANAHLVFDKNGHSTWEVIVL